MPASDQLAIIRIEGMHCHKCEAVIKTALRPYIGVHEVEVDFLSGQASVLFDPNKVQITQLVEAIQSAGYRTTGFSKGGHEPANSEQTSSG